MRTIVVENEREIILDMALRLRTAPAVDRRRMLDEWSLQFAASLKADHPDTTIEERVDAWARLFNNFLAECERMVLHGFGDYQGRA